jgi:DNA-binding transcriptional LysR family regulator
MFPNLEVRHLHAAIVLAEELNFTRAAHRLHISQPALSKQIAELENRHRLHLFLREKGRQIQLSDAGRVFVEEARSALFHAERAVHLAHAAHEGSNNIVMIGHSPHTNPCWVSAILSIRLPLYPRLRVRLVTRFAMELVRGVLAGDMDLAVVTAPPEDTQITAVPFARSPLYAAVPETHPFAHKEHLALRDLARDEWILFAKQVHPFIHDAILEAARREAITAKDTHDIFTSQQAVHLVSEHVGVAILPKPADLGCRADGVLIKPLSDSSLSFETCVVIRGNDDSRLVNEFARSFLRKCAAQGPPAKQMELPLLA